MNVVLDHINDLADLGRQRVLLWAPHPDDETLAAGTLLARSVAAGAVVRVVFATNGDNNPWVQRVVERRWRVGPRQRVAYGQRRRGEALAALAALGVGADQVHFLNYPDQGLSSALVAPQQDLINRCAALIDEHRPTLLVGPSLLDVHPDHSALALALHLALQRVGVAQRPRWQLSYVVHAPPHAPADLALHPSACECRAKAAAAACHRSQQLCHRRAFAAAVRADEPFMVEPLATGPVAGHPVRDSTQGRNKWWLDLTPRARAMAFGRPRLHVLSVDVSGQVRALYADLDWRRPRAPLCAAATGDVLGHMQVERRRRGGFVKLPQVLLADAAQLFVKVSRRVGFFDEAGWWSAPLRSAAGAVEVRSAAGRTCAVIPCYNVAAWCGPVVRAAAQFADTVVAVDDGSTDGTAAALATAAHDLGARLAVITLATNGGKGAALLAGMYLALADADNQVIVTLDADGQHRAQDIPALAAACRDGAQMVIGERRRQGAAPWRSRVGNGLTRRLLGWLLPGCPRDTQSGFRAFDRRCIEALLPQLVCGRYETETEMLIRALQQRCRITAVPIPCIYMDGNRSSHFRPLVDSLRIYQRLLRTLCAGAGVKAPRCTSPLAYVRR